MSSASKIDEQDRKLRDRLVKARRYIHLTSSSGKPMTVEQKLTDEAAFYAEHGDFDEARHRLRLRDKPKWSDPSECQVAYDEAMAAKRGVAA